VSPKDKPLAWLHGEVKTPPFSKAGRIEAGFLLRRLQRGDLLAMPQSRPMPSIGACCHELRVTDVAGNWRIMYRIDDDAIVIAEVFLKKGPKTPKAVIEVCQRRLKEYDNAGKQTKKARGKGLEGR
jgi:phage-related protein